MMVLFPLALGLLSWGLGIVGVCQKPLRRRFLFVGLSLVCCCGSLFCCLQTIYHWVQIEDISAILDCTGAFRLCAGVLIGGTILLNALRFIRGDSQVK